MGSLYIGNNKVTPIVTDVKKVVDNDFFTKFIQGDITEVATDDLQGVTKLGDYTFANKPIASIVIPSSVKSIGLYAFESMKKLVNIDFSYATNLTSLGAASFAWVSALTTLDLSNTKIVTIAANCFESCSNLKNIIFPSTLKYINSGAFLYCSALTSLDFSKTNLTEIDNRYKPDIIHYTYPPFRDSGIVSISLPHSFTKFTTDSSNKYSNIIESNSTITSITYNGTIAEWNTIVSNSGKYWCTKDITVHCTDGDVSVSAAS